MLRFCLASVQNEVPFPAGLPGAPPEAEATAAGVVAVVAGAGDVVVAALTALVAVLAALFVLDDPQAAKASIIVARNTPIRMRVTVFSSPVGRPDGGGQAQGASPIPLPGIGQDAAGGTSPGLPPHRIGLEICGTTSGHQLS